MKDLIELMEKVKDIDELKEKLTECFKSNASTKGLECMDTEESGKVIDMIKDLSETKKYCMESLYYQKVIEAMTSYNETRYNDYDDSRMGYMRPHVPYLDYDRKMYPKDYMRESTMGYTKNIDSTPYNVNDYDGREYSKRNMWLDGEYDNKYGYTRNSSSNDSRYGKSYNDYKMMRKHYTETRSDEDKKEMDLHAEEHVRDTISTIRDIWKDADTSLKKRMKEDFTKLISEMTV